MGMNGVQHNLNIRKTENAYTPNNNVYSLWSIMLITAKGLPAFHTML